MAEAASKSFTLSELAKIALGTDELNDDHLDVLQNLLIILLQKLNCHNERVHIQGFAAKCIEKLLKDTPQSEHYNFQTNNIKNFQEKYDLLAVLEAKVQEIDLKLEQHLKQIRNCHKSNAFVPSKWDFYASPIEDLCTLYMKHNKKFCSLAHSPIFNIELHRRVVPLLLESFKDLEAQIEGMQNKLHEMAQVSKEAAGKLIYNQSIIKDIEEIRSTIISASQDFQESVSEAQEMLHCKLHRVTLPALKKYLEPRFSHIKERLRVLKIVSTKCPPTKPVIIKDKKSCLSCSRHQELDPLFKQFQAVKSIDDETKCFCGRILRKESLLATTRELSANDILAQHCSGEPDDIEFKHEYSDVDKRLKDKISFMKSAYGKKIH